MAIRALRKKIQNFPSLKFFRHLGGICISNALRALSLSLHFKIGESPDGLLLLEFHDIGRLEDAEKRFTLPKI